MNAFRYILGVVTLLLAAAYLFVGFAAIVGAAKMSGEGGDWQVLLDLLAGLLVVVGFGVVMLGGLLLLAAGGLFARKRWAWWLAILLSFPVAACGWFFVSGMDPGIEATVTGIVQMCYPVVAVAMTIAARGK